ncbi:unnamed protein product [Cladocopium goreaui]|uniref:UBX domain-containing protein n=1 Tax=Cladocopium goreaui TaxID=2562237 RepID=A0A9P1CCJ4_9DINO|nr:unnamed protein product [Cladocopium goreaui]
MDQSLPVGLWWLSEFLDTRRLKRAFNSENTIGQVYAFVLIEGGEALQSRSFRLVETMPRRTYEASCKS